MRNIGRILKLKKHTSYQDLISNVWNVCTLGNLGGRTFYRLNIHSFIQQNDPHIIAYSHATHAKLTKHRPCLVNGPLIRYVKLLFLHAPGMPEAFSTPRRVSETDITARAVPWWMSGSRFPLKSVPGKTFPAFRRMHNLQFCASGKRPIRDTPCLTGNIWGV